MLKEISNIFYGFVLDWGCLYGFTGGSAFGFSVAYFLCLVTVTERGSLVYVYVEE